MAYISFLFGLAGILCPGFLFGAFAIVIGMISVDHTDRIRKKNPVAILGMTLGVCKIMVLLVIAMMNFTIMYVGL